MNSVCFWTFWTSNPMCTSIFPGTYYHPSTPLHPSISILIKQHKSIYTKQLPKDKVYNNLLQLLKFSIYECRVIHYYASIHTFIYVHFIELHISHIWIRLWANLCAANDMKREINNCFETYIIYAICMWLRNMFFYSAVCIVEHPDGNHLA